MAPGFEGKALVHPSDRSLLRSPNMFLKLPRSVRVFGRIAAGSRPGGEALGRGLRRDEAEGRPRTADRGTATGPAETAVADGRIQGARKQGVLSRALCIQAIKTFITTRGKV